MADVKGRQGEGALLLVSVFIISTCAILYELLIGTLSTYFLGSSVLYFSLTIGLFLFAMGIGSYLSRYILTKLISRFINIEILLGTVGGFSAFLLHYSFAYTESYQLMATILILLLGIMVGLEIPLVTRLIKQYKIPLRDVIAKVLCFDYIGALVASFIFPLLLLPYLGLMRTAFLVGVLNVGVGLVNIYAFRNVLENTRRQLLVCYACMAVLLAGFIFSFKIEAFFDQMLYRDQIIYSGQSKYQRIVLTKYGKDLRLFLDGNLQFSSLDEYRYHETLVHLPMLLSPNPENVLVMGGGDGLALREILKYKNVKSIDLVDLDKEVTDLAQANSFIKQLSNNSLQNNKINIFNEDAFKFIQHAEKIYSVIIIDLPDPANTDISRLYTREFYQMVHKKLAADGVVITQSTSPYFSSKAFWCIHKTMAEVFPQVAPYNVYVPSFGNWGFNLAAKYSFPKDKNALTNTLQQKLSANQNHLQLKYLNAEVLLVLCNFGNDMLDSASVETNTLSSHKLLDYYAKSWSNWE